MDSYPRTPCAKFTMKYPSQSPSFPHLSYPKIKRAYYKLQLLLKAVCKNHTTTIITLATCNQDIGYRTIAPRSNLPQKAQDMSSQRVHSFCASCFHPISKILKIIPKQINLLTPFPLAHILHIIQHFYTSVNKCPQFLLHTLIC